MIQSVEVEALKINTLVTFSQNRHNFHGLNRMFYYYRILHCLHNYLRMTQGTLENTRQSLVENILRNPENLNENGVRYWTK